MKIIKYINDEKWEIDVKQDYKHKSKPIESIDFLKLLNKLQVLYIPGMFEKMNMMKEGMTFSGIIRPTASIRSVPENVMIEPTKICSVDPTYPIHILMNNDKGIKYQIHCTKDGGISGKDLHQLNILMTTYHHHIQHQTTTDTGYNI